MTANKTDYKELIQDKIKYAIKTLGYRTDDYSAIANYCGYNTATIMKEMGVVVKLPKESK
jgi:hypothetical protein